MRWYRQPLVRRFVFFGAAPALVFLLLFFVLSGEWLIVGPLIAFLWGAFITYEMAVRTRLKPRHLLARMATIAAVALIIGLLT
jgi:VIT1/CCC1 family predicted Fe2+/Mn2+ transporter